MIDRHLITCEYPPQIGGVAGHTALLARALVSAGCEVHVWCPAAGGSSREPAPEGITIHRAFERFAARELRDVGLKLEAWASPRRLLVQWVPHGYGSRSLNLPFCAWLLWRARVRGDQIDVMVHEPFLAFGEGSRKQDAAALVHRLMAVLLAGAADRVFVSIPAWIQAWRPYALGRRVDFVWAPVPSAIPDTGAAPDAGLRARYSPGGPLVGHFGARGGGIGTALESAIAGLVAGRPDARVLLIGAGGEAFRTGLVERHPDLAGCVHATGELTDDEVSRHLRLCDVMLQPYPDGVSTRRSSAAAVLAHGLPLVTSLGRLSEPFWQEAGGVVLVPAGRPEKLADAVAGVLEDRARAERLGRKARALHDHRFGLEPLVSRIVDVSASRR